MKLALISDLHLEFKSSKPVRLDREVDVLVLAGDVSSAAKAVDEAVALSNDMAKHIVMVAGNHEFYGTRLDKGYARLRADAEAYNLVSASQVHFLQNDSVVLEGYTFLGATLWTDYKLGSQRHLDMLRATDYMNDHRRIKFKDGETYRRFLPKDALKEHQISRMFLKTSCPSIVVTHHAPAYPSIHEKYRADQMNSAYASDLSWMMYEDTAPAYWFHGHMHDPADYILGNTRVISNPRGYPGERANPEVLYLDV
jgi:Icc-related predicted phosphoesterase